MKRQVLGVLLAAALSGCGGGGFTGFTGHPCPALGIGDLNARLVSPAGGATGVPTTVGSVSFTVTLAPLRSGALALWIAPAPPGSLPAVQGGPITTDGAGVSSSSLPALQPHTTYEARVAAAPTDPVTGCSARYDAVLGTFTTQ